MNRLFFTFAACTTAFFTANFVAAQTTQTTKEVSALETRVIDATQATELEVQITQAKELASPHLSAADEVPTTGWRTQRVGPLAEEQLELYGQTSESPRMVIQETRERQVAREDALRAVSPVHPQAELGTAVERREFRRSLTRSGQFEAEATTTRTQLGATESRTVETQAIESREVAGETTTVLESESRAFVGPIAQPETQRQTTRATREIQFDPVQSREVATKATTTQEESYAFVGPIAQPETQRQTTRATREIQFAPVQSREVATEATTAQEESRGFVGPIVAPKTQRPATRRQVTRTRRSSRASARNAVAGVSQTRAAGGRSTAAVSPWYMLPLMGFLALCWYLLKCFPRSRRSASGRRVEQRQSQSTSPSQRVQKHVEKMDIQGQSVSGSTVSSLAATKRDLSRSATKPQETRGFKVAQTDATEVSQTEVSRTEASTQREASSYKRSTTSKRSTTGSASGSQNRSTERADLRTGQKPESQETVRRQAETGFVANQDSTYKVTPSQTSGETRQVSSGRTTSESYQVTPSQKSDETRQVSSSRTTSESYQVTPSRTSSESRTDEIRLEARNQGRSTASETSTTAATSASLNSKTSETAGRAKADAKRVSEASHEATSADRQGKSSLETARAGMVRDGQSVEDEAFDLTPQSSSEARQTNGRSTSAGSRGQVRSASGGYTSSSADISAAGSTRNGSKTTQRAAGNGADDLTKIRGIGPKAADALRWAGVDSFRKLEQASPNRIEEILAAVGTKFQFANPVQWIEQARFAAAGDWDGLKAWQLEFKDETAEAQTSASSRRSTASGSREELRRSSGSAADDLTWISGIGPATKRFLNKNGINCFEQIATMSADQLSELFSDVQDRFQLLNTETWASQAKELIRIHRPAATDKEMELLGEINSLTQTNRSSTSNSGSATSTSQNTNKQEYSS